MAFTLEDGTGIAGANAYASVAEVDAYFDDRGVPGWNGDANQKQFAIIKATDYIDKRFGKRFIGKRADGDQGLEWPRTSAIDLNGIEWADQVPTILKQATAEYAKRALEAELVTDPVGNPVPAAGPLIYLRNRVEGAVEQEQRWGDTTRNMREVTSQTVNDNDIPSYPAADLLIERLLKSASGGFLARA